MFIEAVVGAGVIAYIYLVIESDPSIDRAKSEKYSKDLEDLRSSFQRS
ncbi:MAG: hypothetical protein JW778_06135 [Candidatus Altiarchaeota archaeon]|nr:hypothetical protein [Candidatus Altiarchaeota archaeon]